MTCALRITVFDVVIYLTFFLFQFPVWLCVAADQYPSIKKCWWIWTDIFFQYSFLCISHWSWGGSFRMDWLPCVSHISYADEKKGPLFLHKTSVRVHRNYYLKKKNKRRRLQHYDWEGRFTLYYHYFRAVLCGNVLLRIHSNAWVLIFL